MRRPLAITIALLPAAAAVADGSGVVHDDPLYPGYQIQRVEQFPRLSPVDPATWLLCEADDGLLYRCAAADLAGGSVALGALGDGPGGYSVGDCVVSTADGWEWGECGGSVTETDPVYSADPAAGITAQDLLDYDAAFGWGDHAAAGYLTSETDDQTAAEVAVAATPSNYSAATATPTTLVGYGITDAATSAQGALADSAVQTETDPVYSADPASGITAQHLLDWDAAFAWGDHAGLYEPAGVTVADVTDLDDDAATLTVGPSASVSGDNTGDQDLSGLQSKFITVFNNTGSQIGADLLVSITGSAGAVPLVEVADKDSLPSCGCVAGITTAAIAAGTTGQIQISGEVEDLNTSAISPGAPLWLGNAGSIVDTLPATGGIVRIGKAGVIAPAGGTILIDTPAQDQRASETSFDPAGTSLSSTRVEAAIVELATDPLAIDGGTP